MAVAAPHPTQLLTLGDFAATAAAATTVVTKTSFWSLLLAFVSGGLFFSTVVAALAAGYAFGLDNVKRVTSVLQVVARRILKLGVAMLHAAWVALVDDTSSTPWLDARAALREGFAQTRQAAAEGVDAIKLEASLYAAAIGAPGLLPLQYALDRLTPRTLLPAIEAALVDALDGVVNPNIRSLRLKRFDFGGKPPRLEAARLYELGEENIAMDVDVNWPSALTAEIEVVTARVGARVPVTVRNLRFEGAVRLMVLQLTAMEPGYGAVLLSFPTAPKVGLDVKVAGGELTKLPWLRAELQNVIQVPRRMRTRSSPSLTLSRPSPGPSLLSPFTRAPLHPLLSRPPSPTHPYCPGDGGRGVALAAPHGYPR